MTFSTPAGDQAMRAAIAAVEQGSAVEVVVAVRRHARRWLVQHAIVGIVAAVAVLVYAAVFEWDVWAILAFPLVAGAISALAVEVVPPLHRFLVPPRIHDAHVLEAARALFVARRVHATAGRTGMLVYIAVHARACEIIGDVAVEAKLGDARLDAMSTQLAAAVASGAEAVAKILASFAPELAAALPKGAKTADELPDEPLSV